ncbi:MAG: tetratricopeptide repeat protein [Polyangiaceae bacterium]
MKHPSRVVFPLAFAVTTVATVVPSSSPTSWGPSVRPASADATSPLDAGRAALRATDYPRAEAELAKIRGTDENEARLLLATAFVEQGKFAEAEKALAPVPTTPAFDVRVRTLRATILRVQGKTDAAKALLAPFRSKSGEESRRARLLLGELLLAGGDRAAAEPVLMSLVDEYNGDQIKDTDAEGLALAGRAAFFLRSAKDANTLFNKSERVDKKRVETLLFRAELFLDKYDPGHAEEALRDLLEVAPKHAAALVLMARVKLDQAMDFDGAEKLAKDALAVNPKLTAAYAVRVGSSLRDMDLAQSEATLNEGLAIDPNDLELLSLRAAVRFLADDKAGFETAKREVFKRNKEYSRFFGIVGEFAEWEHRYDDIVAMMREATKVDPDDEKAWAELGLTLLRSGDETQGLEALRKAWAKDHFNVRVFNTLNLYEQTIATQYESKSDGPFTIRYPKDEKPVLERYVPALLGDAWASMKARYDYVPKSPVAVELYGSRQYFSVRTSGLPNIGIQGVCFGRVLAAMSPKSEAFNWGNVVWHELGHVFAIQLSKNHVPRWFTEGLSEYETIARRPEWQRELDPQLWLAIKTGRLPAAVDMNRAFTHASDGNDVTVAYYASSQMLVWTVSEFGMKRVRRALELWGEGKQTPEVLKLAFDVTPGEYDARFRAWALAKMARYDKQFLFDDTAPKLEESEAKVKASPKSAIAHAERAFALLVRAHQKQEAEAELKEALALEPTNRVALYLASKLALMTKDVDGAAKALDTLVKSGGDGYSARMVLADVAAARKDAPARRAALEAAHGFDPSQPDPLRGLLDIARESKDDDAIVRVLSRLAPLEQHDQKLWRVLLEKLVAKKAYAEAVKVGEAALFVDVESPDTHTLYAEALSKTGDHGKATFELESALACAPKPKVGAKIHVALAREAAALGKKADAKFHKDEASKLDPENVEARALAD